MVAPFHWQSKIGDGLANLDERKGLDLILTLPQGVSSFSACHSYFACVP